MKKNKNLILVSGATGCMSGRLLAALEKMGLGASCRARCQTFVHVVSSVDRTLLCLTILNLPAAVIGVGSCDLQFRGGEVRSVKKASSE